MSILQYSIDVMEALHKPLKDAYRRFNQVNATKQILDTMTREHALQMREFKIEVCSCKFPVDCGILDLINIQDSR